MSTRLKLIGRHRDGVTAAAAQTISDNLPLLLSISADLNAVVDAINTDIAIKKIAVSGDAHSIYGQLSMSNGDVDATIPGNGILSLDSIEVFIGGLIQTDFVVSGRTITLGFTPTLNNQNRMVVNYEEV